VDSQYKYVLRAHTGSIPSVFLQVAAGNVNLEGRQEDEEIGSVEQR
jgi:hypothetical protein